MKFGICSAPGALGSTERLVDILVDAGADYLDWTVGSIMSSEAEFEKLRRVVEKGPLRAEAWMSFLPPHQRVTGPDVDLKRVLEYATTAMQRAKILGGEVIVLGSAGARKVPAGFDFEVARAQFIEFGRELGPRAEEAGIVIAIEPLNKGEDNFICSVAQGADFVDAIAHPSVQLLADFYHMDEENEPLKNVENAGARLHHTHLADTHRVAPGYAKKPADLVGFFRALRIADYDARCSFEGKTDDLARQAKPLLATMREKHAHSAEFRG
ncbi:Sugar phosphate isomerase/epimerase [Abditibacterium utsteinense]|uniref:Sugar phosphate isomerase/epimerase n=1 Tax=Abditibacterium utsteinense TaxID=1960156 RepID=A0A2S8SXK6_9BACT|nr:sugar phosphate isomerase/epimerase [Abditibacterium utsteinense]PQV65524.1 Sugar phosphate isomerase/epimerase [Abditibacterium utsteinense]